MQTIMITSDDIDALARTAMSEVGHFGRYGPDVLKGGVEAVVDTILNRVAHPSYPDTIGEVVNARAQFSAIGAPGGVKTWRRLRRASDAVEQIVKEHLAERLEGKACTVRGAGNFLNPFFSSSRALRDWGNHVVRHHVAKWGQGQDIHFHGYAPNSGPPSDYTLQVGDRTHTFTGRGVSTAKPAGAPLAFVADTANASAADADAGLPIITSGEDLLAYKVEEVPDADGVALQSVLNRRSAEGWCLRQILPSSGKMLIVFESSQAEDLIYEDDDRSDNDQTEEPAAPSVLASDTPEGRFEKFITGLKLQHFSPREFLVMGGQHALAGRAKGKNTLPNEDLWDNIVLTARVLDELRAALGGKIRLSSVYRSPAYNALLPGAATGSQHLEFRAADFSCADGRNSVWWAKQLKSLRDQGLFEGGIGVYPTFVHVDTRGENVQWGPWRSRVFG